jgi:hypothetical protein
MRLNDQVADLKQIAGSFSPALGILLAALNAMMPEARFLSNAGQKKNNSRLQPNFLPFNDPNPGQHNPGALVLRQL